MQSIRFIIFSRIILVVTAYFALTAGVSFFVITGVIRQFVVDDSRSSLTFIVNNVRSNYFARLRDLDDVAEMPGFKPFDAARSAQLIDRFLEFSSVFGTIHVYKPDGTLLYAKRQPSIPAYHYDSNFNIHPQAEFIHLAEKVLHEQRPAVSETFYTSTGDLLQTYVVPIVTPGPKPASVGIISGGVFPLRHRLDHLVEGLKLAEHNFILITDTKGNTVAKSGIPSDVDLSTLKPYVDQALAGLLGPRSPRHQAVMVAEADKESDLDYLLLSSSIREMKLLVTLGVSTQLVVEKQTELVKYVFIMLVGGLIFSIVASMLVGNRLSRPLIEIFHVLKQLSIGDFSARVTYGDNDEIGYLGELINRLSAKIRKEKYLGELWSTDDETTSILDGSDGPS